MWASEVAAWTLIGVCGGWLLREAVGLLFPAVEYRAPHPDKGSR